MKKLINVLWLFIATFCFSTTFMSCDDDSVTPDPVEMSFEVWATDQGLNTITVLDGNTLEEKAVIDIALAGASKPHMCLFSPDFKYAYVACVGGDGATVIIRTSDYQVVKTMATGKSSHAAIPTWDGTKVWVAVIGEQTLREIVTDTENETFTLGRELDLRAALPDETAFPANKPICHMFEYGDDECYVTLGGGGLCIVDVNSMQVTKSWDVSQIAPAGCGLINGPIGSNLMFANSGTINTGNFYMFDIESDELMLTMDTGSDGMDAHGVNFTPDGKELWMINRLSDNIRIFNPQTQQFTETITGVGDAPDLLVFSPDGSKAFITTRGPNPSTGTHDISGQAPGVLIMDVASRSEIQLVQLGNRDMSDPHGIALLPGR